LPERTTTRHLYNHLASLAGAHGGYDRRCDERTAHDLRRAKVALGERGTPWWERSDAEHEAAVAACLDATTLD
jgi:hypothetical protein